MISQIAVKFKAIFRRLSIYKFIPTSQLEIQLYKTCLLGLM